MWLNFLWQRVPPFSLPLASRQLIVATTTFNTNSANPGKFGTSLQFCPVLSSFGWFQRSSTLPDTHTTSVLLPCFRFLHAGVCRRNMLHLPCKRPQSSQSWLKSRTGTIAIFLTHFPAMIRTWIYRPYMKVIVSRFLPRAKLKKKKWRRNKRTDEENHESITTSVSNNCYS